MTWVTHKIESKRGESEFAYKLQIDSMKNDVVDKKAEKWLAYFE